MTLFNQNSILMRLLSSLIGNERLYSKMILLLFASELGSALKEFLPVTELQRRRGNADKSKIILFLNKNLSCDAS